MRKRTIKPDFFSDPKTGRLSPTSQILFIGMWCLADREGYIEDDNDFIKIQILPYLKSNIDKNIEELISNKLIIKCNYNNKNLLNIVNFKKHQPIHPNEAKSPYVSIDSEDVIKCNYKELHPNVNGISKGNSNVISKKEYGIYKNILLTDDEYKGLLKLYKTEENLKRAFQHLAVWKKNKKKKQTHNHGCFLEHQWVYKKTFENEGSKFNGKDEATW